MAASQGTHTPSLLPTEVAAQHRSPPKTHGHVRLVAGPQAMPLATSPIWGGPRGGGATCVQLLACEARTGQAAGGRLRAFPAAPPAGIGSQWQSRASRQKPSAEQQASPCGQVSGPEQRASSASMRLSLSLARERRPGAPFKARPYSGRMPTRCLSLSQPSPLPLGGRPSPTRWRSRSGAALCARARHRHTRSSGCSQTTPGTACASA